MKRRTLVVGWIAFGLSLVIVLLWAWWGTLEAFHEGWWKPTLSERLVQTLMYLTPMGICLALCAIAVRLPKFGAVVYFLLGGVFSWFIFNERRGNLSWEVVLSWLPVTGLMIGVGLLWWLGRVKPYRLAYGLLIGLPLLLIIGAGAYPCYKVSSRITEVNLEAQLVEGNDVVLIWAPAGPGWVRDAKHAANWHQAVETVALLNEAGTELMDEPQNIWRLPTVDEAVRSMARHGVNSGGSWNPETKATFDVTPDKEPPLWDPYAETIYWWTATEDGSDNAWIVVYDGNTWSRSKDMRMGSKGFRAVKDPVVNDLDAPAPEPDATNYEMDDEGDTSESEDAAEETSQD